MAVTTVAITAVVITAAAITTAVHVTTVAVIMVLGTTAAVITARLIIAAVTIATGITDIAITIRMPAASGVAAGTPMALARAGAGRTITASSSGSAANPAAQSEHDIFQDRGFQVAVFVFPGLPICGA